MADAAREVWTDGVLVDQEGDETFGDIGVVGAGPWRAEAVRVSE